MTGQPIPPDDAIDKIFDLVEYQPAYKMDAKVPISYDATKAKAALKRSIAEWEKEARIDELEKLSKSKWADLAYDVPAYLRDRIQELKGGKTLL